MVENDLHQKNQAEHHPDELYQFASYVPDFTLYLRCIEEKAVEKIPGTQMMSLDWEKFREIGMEIAEQKQKYPAKYRIWDITDDPYEKVPSRSLLYNAITEVKNNYDWQTSSKAAMKVAMQTIYQAHIFDDTQFRTTSRFANAAMTTSIRELDALGQYKKVLEFDETNMRNRKTIPDRTNRKDQETVEIAETMVLLNSVDICKQMNNNTEDLLPRIIQFQQGYIAAHELTHAGEDAYLALYGHTTFANVKHSRTADHWTLLRNQVPVIHSEHLANGVARHVEPALATQYLTDEEWSSYAAILNARRSLFNQGSYAYFKHLQQYDFKPIDLLLLEGAIRANEDTPRNIPGLFDPDQNLVKTFCYSASPYTIQEVKRLLKPRDKIIYRRDKVE
jgi:hypothetical protein